MVGGAIHRAVQESKDIILTSTMDELSWSTIMQNFTYMELEEDHPYVVTSFIYLKSRRPKVVVILEEKNRMFLPEHISVRLLCDQTLLHLMLLAAERGKLILTYRAAKTLGENELFWSVMDDVVLCNKMLPHAERLGLNIKLDVSH